MGCGASSNKVCPAVMDHKAMLEKKLDEMEASLDSVEIMQRAAFQILKLRNKVREMLDDQETYDIIRQLEFQSDEEDGLLSNAVSDTESD